jgi:transglutaminase-like putative cysteine protease
MSRAEAPIAKDAIATAALCSYTLAVAYGFARVFSGWEFMSDFALIAIVGHGVSFALRRARVSGWIAVPGLSLLLLWLLAMIYYRPSLNWIVPGSTTWDDVERELSLVRDQFPTAVAPVLYDVVGWASLSGFALVLVLVMSDSFAFRAEARGEALVPGGVLFVFIAALGDDRLRIASTALLIATGVLTVVALRQLHDRTRSTVLSPRGRLGSVTVPVALATALAIALLAGIVGPRIPGARAEPLYDTTGRGGTNLIDNPLVDIRSRLTSRGNVKLFKVNSNQPDYWRLITLAEFDGQRFTLPSSPLTDIGAPTDVTGSGIRQRVQILALEGDVVPAAADVAQAIGTSQGTRFNLTIDPDSRTLLAPQDLLPGDVIDVVSVPPTVSPEVLRAASVTGVPDEVYLELPDNLPDVVDDETERLVAGAASPYDAALAIQAWFRDPNEFSYSLEVQQGHDGNAIESFFRVRAGYCEQFAATFAAMARIAGIPSRVAVGYTTGNQDDEPGWYTVIGKNAHAWPELWFDGVGWVRFEPTPGRGAPGAESYLPGVTFAQDDAGVTAVGGADPIPGPDPTAPPTVVTNPDAPATTVRPAGGAEDGSGPANQPFESEDPDAEPTPVPVSAGSADDGGGFPWTWFWVITLAVVAFAGPWALRRINRFRHRVHGTREQVAAAWDRARSAASEAGVEGHESMTSREWTAATAKVLPVAARPMGSLGDVVDMVLYARPDEIDLDRRGTFGDSLGDDCDLWATQIYRITTDNLTTTKRVQRYFTDYR